MYIVELMTCHTSQRCIFIVFSRVTELAAKFPMFPLQRVVSVQVVVKLRPLPRLFLMTVITTLAQSTTVIVILFVTGETVALGLRIGLLLWVAGATG